MNQIPAFQEENDYIRLLGILIKIVEANKGTLLGEDDRLLNAEGLLKKFIGHATSALYLFRSTTLPDIKITDKGISFFDPGSINVIGRAVIKNTRIPLASIVNHYRSGMSVEEILEGYPSLTPAQLFDALSYYFDNKEEIDKQLD